MLEMNVFVGLNDPNDPKDILVQPDPAAAHSGDEILWRVHSLNPKVAEVEVEFSNTGDKFFQSQNPTADSNKCRRQLRGGQTGKQGNMWGVAPGLSASGAKQSKYSIRAYGSSGNVLHQIDPTIVTVDP